MPRVSVVVVNFNGVRLLADCLDSIAAQEVPGGLEVVVVDNASTDGSREHLRARPDVRLVEVDRNLGFAGGNNVGIRAASADLVALLNTDARARPGWLAGLAAALDGDPGAGAATPKVVFPGRPVRIQNAGSVIYRDGSGADRGSGELDAGQYDRPEEVFAFCGNGVMLRRRALDEAGLFDEDFFAYYEDTDLSWRLRRRGWRILYRPEAVVEHDHATTSGEWSPQFVFWVDRNRLLMIARNASAGFAARAVLSLGRLVLAGRRSRQGPDRKGGRSGPGRHREVVESFFRLLPRTLWKRRRNRRGGTVPDARLEAWAVERPR